VAKLRESQGAARGIERKGGFLLEVREFKSISDFRIAIVIATPIKTVPEKSLIDFH
jgi:hypothetical protein